MTTYAVILVLLMVLIFLIFKYEKKTPKDLIPPGPLDFKCVDNEGVHTPVLKDKQWTCPTDKMLKVQACSTDRNCAEGQWCSEDGICRLACTDETGARDTFALNRCSDGYSAVPWRTVSYKMSDALHLPSKVNGQTLQVRNPFYGDTNGCSNDSTKLINYVKYGLDLDIPKNGYSSFFDDVCPDSDSKYISFEYRYV